MDRGRNACAAAHPEEPPAEREAAAPSCAAQADGVASGPVGELAREARAGEPARPGHEAVGRSPAEFRARATRWRPPPAVPCGDDECARVNRAEPGPPFRPPLEGECFKI